VVGCLFLVENGAVFSLPNWSEFPERTWDSLVNPIGKSICVMAEKFVRKEN